jgi:putative glycosyl transferase, group 1 family
MKIIHIVWSFRFGGIETMLVNIINEQLKLNNDVHLIIIEDSAVEPTLLKSFDERIKIHYGHRKEKGNLIFPVLRLNLLLLKLNPNVIHIHSSSMYRIIMVPWLKKVVNSTLHALPNTVNTVAIKNVPQVFAISESVSNSLKNKYGVDSIVNPNGIYPENIKKKVNYNNIFQIVQVSRLQHENKGQHILLEAAAILKQRGYKNFRITFIGDGESRSFLENKVKTLNLGGYVEFLGKKEQTYIFEHLCDYDLFVQPSIHEGFGLTIAEAMAAKLPVIVSSGQGPEEVIDYGKYGYVFENGNPSECANKIEIFLKHENNPFQIEEAYRRVLDLYDIKVTVNTYMNKYLRRI